MIDDVTPQVVDKVVRAIRDPMIGGWPLIHWEWVFSTECEDSGAARRNGRGIEVVGAWPESDDRKVTLRYHPAAETPDQGMDGH